MEDLLELSANGSVAVSVRVADINAEAQWNVGEGVNLCNVSPSSIFATETKC